MTKSLSQDVQDVQDAARSRRALGFPRLARCLVSLTIALLAVGAVASSGAAQDGALIGQVTNANGMPLPGAEVRVGSVDGVAVTGNDGVFRVSGVPSGLYYFGVRQLGYHPIAQMLTYDGSDTLRVTLERVTATKELDTLKVQAQEDARWERTMRRYDIALSAARSGNVVTGEDIDQRNPVWTSDLFQTMPGFLVVGSGGGAQVVGSRDRCSPAVYLDGLYSPGTRVNDVAPQFIDLLVSYSSSATVPAEFQDIRANADCGTVAIFTL